MALTKFLFPSPAPRSVAGIARWWESRRLHYNAIVGVAGLTSIGLVSAISALPPDPRTLMFSWVPVIAFAVLANVCYFLGPMVEVGVEKVWRGKILPTGPVLFRMGLTFSVGLTFLPTLITGMDWLLRVIRAIF